MLSPRIIRYLCEKKPRKKEENGIRSCLLGHPESTYAQIRHIFDQPTHSVRASSLLISPNNPLYERIKSFFDIS